MDSLTLTLKFMNTSLTHLSQYTHIHNLENKAVSRQQLMTYESNDDFETHFLRACFLIDDLHLLTLSSTTTTTYCAELTFSLLSFL